MSETKTIYEIDEWKDEFMDAFYQLWPSEQATFYDMDSPIPWGCPWVWDKNFKATGPADESAKRYFEKYQSEISDFITFGIMPEFNI